MRIHLLVATAALSLAFPSARSQVAVYGTFSAVRLAGVDTGVSVTPNGLQTNTDSFFANGFGAGVTLNFLHLGPATLGVDFRGSVASGTPSAKTLLGGVKLGFHPPHTRLKPYVQFSSGYLQTLTQYRGTDPPSQTVTNKYGAYEVIGGLDYSIRRFIDLRVVEVGAGRTFSPSVQFENSANSATLFTINSGVVFHF
jgi:hypothetical protein